MNRQITDPLYVIRLMQSYNLGGFAIRNSIGGKKENFMGMSIDITDLKSLDKYEVHYVFIGIGGLTDDDDEGFTLLAIGLDAKKMRLKTDAYDYGQRIPPKKVNIEKCPALSIEGQKKSHSILKQKRNKNLLHISTYGGSGRIGWNVALALLENYQVKPDTLETEDGIFYGTIMSKTDLQFFTSQTNNITQVAFCLSQKNIKKKKFSMVAMALNEKSEVICDKIFLLDSEISAKEMLNIRLR